MAMVKRHWKLAVILVVFLVGIGSAVVLLPASAQDVSTPGSGDDIAAAPVEDIAAVDYGRIQALRRELDLDNAALAAMGLGGEQAATILTDIKEWHAANRERLSAADADIAAARKELRVMMKRMNVGPRDEAVLNSIPRLRDALVSAQNARTVLCDSLAEAVTRTFSDPQNTAWTVIRQNEGVPIPYRYAPGLDVEQREQLMRLYFVAVRTGQPCLCEDVLTSSQKDAVTVAVGNMRMNMEAVLQAESEILPVPAELMESGVMTMEVAGEQQQQ